MLELFQVIAILVFVWAVAKGMYRTYWEYYYPEYEAEDGLYCGCGHHLCYHAHGHGSTTCHHEDGTGELCRCQRYIGPDNPDDVLKELSA